MTCTKESLSEYGSGWEWEYNTYAHVFDQTTSDGVPYRYSKDGTGDANNMHLYICSNDIEKTDGQILHSGSVYTNQRSCRAMASNAGNYYSWPAATAGGYHETKGYNEPNSVCPKGWQLTVNVATDIKSWSYLITNTYNISSSGFNDSSIRYLPMSFVRSGLYHQGSLNVRANSGCYWSSTATNSSFASPLNFTSGYLGSQYYYNKDDGYSVRCVNKQDE